MRNLAWNILIFLFFHFLFNTTVNGQDSIKDIEFICWHPSLTSLDSLPEPRLRIQQNRSAKVSSCETDQGRDIKYSISINCYKDLSDTYDGGDLFSGEFLLAGSCFGLMASLGYFQSHSIFTYNVTVEEINRSLSIQLDELAIMKTGSLSLVILPVKAGKFTFEVIGGMVLAKAQSLQFCDVDYSYSFTDEHFNYLYANYMYFRETHFGYQAGMNARLDILTGFGIQLNMRMQNLSGGGTFFFAGAGLCFKLN